MLMQEYGRLMDVEPTRHTKSMKINSPGCQ